MIQDFSVANIQDMRDATRSIWTSSFKWDDVEALLANPVDFFRDNGKEIRFGDPCANIIMLFISSPNQGSEIVVEGMDDTNILTIRANWNKAPLPHDPDQPPPPDPEILISREMAIVVQARVHPPEPDLDHVGPDNIGDVHFHIDDNVHRDVDGMATQIYRMIRFPSILVQQVNAQIDNYDRPYAMYVNGTNRAPSLRPKLVAGPIMTALVESSPTTGLKCVCSRTVCPATVTGSSLVTLTPTNLLFTIYNCPGSMIM